MRQLTTFSETDRLADLAVNDFGITEYKRIKRKRRYAESFRTLNVLLDHHTYDSGLQ